jgi:predicted glycoside hydrolase/deacetylase ChbG (UPF0249 family)
MRRLIVTADDFGLTPGVNAGILEAHEHGIVTATSLMVNGIAADAALGWAREHRSLAVGLHFVLTFGRPIGPLDPLGDLVDEDGRFRRLGTGAHERASSGDVRAELRAQLRRFDEAVGRPPTHIDGHHHVHALPGILPAVIEEAGQRGLRVRAPDRATRERLRLERIHTSDRFEDGFYGPDATDEAALSSIFERLPEGETEMMCHPAKPDDVLSGISSYVEPRYRELATLTSPLAREFLERHGVHLVSARTTPSSPS